MSLTKPTSLAALTGSILPTYTSSTLVPYSSVYARRSNAAVVGDMARGIPVGIYHYEKWETYAPVDDVLAHLRYNMREK
jgi:hypothetical protein